MQLGMIGLGRMGSSMTQRLIGGGHACVVFDSNSVRVKFATDGGATGSSSLEELVTSLDAPRIVWLMLPAGAVDATLQQLAPLLKAGDVIIDGPRMSASEKVASRPLGTGRCHDDVSRCLIDFSETPTWLQHAASR